jgi:hypothetical protein
MAGNHALQEQSPAEIVQEMATAMEAMAMQDDWERVEDIAVRLRAAVMQVPEYERRSLLLAVRHSTGKVHAAAEKARDKVTDKLSALRRGRDAAEAYKSTY